MLLYVTTGAWGAGTGTPLDADEIDENFYTLHLRIQDLEDNPPSAVGISNIQVIGSQLKIFLSDATEFGPYTLPIAAFQWRGNWVDTQQYYELDIVTVIGQGLYMVLIDHIAVAPFDEARVITGNPVYLKLFGDDPFRYDFGPFVPGKPGLGIVDGSRLYSHLFAQDVYILEDMPETRFELATAPAADLVFPIRKNGATVIGNLTFPTGQTDPVITFPDSVQFTNVDRISIMKPAAVDVSALELTGTVVGRRGTLAP